MAKVKVTETKSEVREIDLEYPIYLYFQDEDWNDEFIMVDEGSQIKVAYSFGSMSIQKDKRQMMILPEFIENNLTTRKQFLEAFNEAVTGFKRVTKTQKFTHVKKTCNRNEKNGT